MRRAMEQVAYRVIREAYHLVVGRVYRQLLLVAARHYCLRPPVPISVVAPVTVQHYPVVLAHAIRQAVPKARAAEARKVLLVFL